MVQDRLTITVPEAGRLLGIGRDAAYAAARRGEIPTLRLGRRLVVPVVQMLKMLGHPEQIENPTALGRQAATPGSERLSTQLAPVASDLEARTQLSTMSGFRSTDDLFMSVGGLGP